MNTPITIHEGAWSATVHKKGNVFHLSQSYLDIPQEIYNSFASREEPLALGRALVLACGPNRPVKQGRWDWHVGQTTDVGWLTYRDQFVRFPRKFISADFGYSLGCALLFMGVLLEIRSELKVAIAKMNEPVAISA